MFRFFKKLNHPVVDVIIMIILLIVVLVSCNQVGHAAVQERGKKPMISIKKVEKRVGCVEMISEEYEYDDFNAYHVFDCYDSAGRQIYGENFVSLREQAAEVTGWETGTAWAEGAFWMARCKGYHVWVENGRSYAWSKAFAKKYKGCTIQRIDGATYSRKAA